MALWLLLHCAPYVLALSAAGCLLAIGLTGNDFRIKELAQVLAVALAVALLLVLVGTVSFGIAFGITSGITIGIVNATTVGVKFESALFLPFALALAISVGLALWAFVRIGGQIRGGFTFGLAFGLLIGLCAWLIYWLSIVAQIDDTRTALVLAIVSGIAFGLATRILGISIASLIGLEITAVIACFVVFAVISAGGLSTEDSYWQPPFALLPFCLAFFIGSLISSTRIYYQLVHPLFVRPNPPADWYPRHPVAWDDLCSVPFLGLDQLLADYAEKVPEFGSAEIERLISSYPSQRRMAIRASVRLLARRAGKAANLAILDEIIAPDGAIQGALHQRRSDLSPPFLVEKIDDGPGDQLY